jgi:heptosyltransferase I
VVATSKPAKNWPPERFAELADRVVAVHGARVVLLGGNSQIERDAAATIERLATSKPRNLLGSGLKPLLGLLEACSVVVSSDTGPYHMCVAMNVPAVGLFGYTRPPASHLGACGTALTFVTNYLVFATCRPPGNEPSASRDARGG